MSVRVLSILAFLFSIPLFSLQSGTVQREQQMIWSRGQMMKPDSPPELDLQAARIEAIRHDAADLSTLSASLQSDLQNLQKGLLAKDLEQKLKNLEKLSKKLRRELAP